MSADSLLPLGLQEYDRINDELGGGIPRGSIILMEGDYGAGKSAFSQRFAYGFCEEGASVTFLSTELNTSGFVDQMHSLNYSVIDELLDEQLLFLHADFDTTSTFSSDGSGERKELLRRLMNAELMWDAEVVIIDTFDAILRNDPHFESLVRKNEERQAALEIVSFYRSMINQGKIIMLTVDPSTLNDDALDPFRAIADVFLELEMVEVGGEVRRNINVKRFAGMGEQVGDTIGFSVRAGTGIVIESRSVA